MGITKRSGALFGLTPLLLAACAPAPGPAVENSPPEFGWIEGNCLVSETAIANLPRSIVVSPADGSTELIDATVISSVGEGKDCSGLPAERADANRGPGVWFYMIESAQPIASGIGIIGSPPEKLLTYEQCLSSEGVWFRVLDGHRTAWEAYEYLGYDVEPTCSFD